MARKFFRNFILFTFLVVSLLPAWATISSIKNEKNNQQRIEREYKLAVPIAQFPKVLNYLKNTFIENKTALEELEPGLTSYWNTELFTDIYFDTPDLKLLHMQSGVRHRHRINLTNTEDRKSGRELMQIKISGITAHPADRGEYKFDIEYPNKTKSTDDLNPAIGIIKMTQREEFKKHLQALGIDPYALVPLLKVYDKRDRIYFQKNKVTLSSISLDDVTVKTWWATIHFAEIEPELNEIAFTKATPQQKQEMDLLLQKIINKIQARFPAITNDLTPKYNKAFLAIEEKIPFYRLLVKYNLHSNDTMWALILIAALCILLLIYTVINAVRVRRKK